MTYSINHVDINKAPILVNDGEENSTSTDINLFGRIRLEYGQQLNENLLHLLENFAAPEISGSTFHRAVPDFNNATYNRKLSRPITGQLWYNKTRKKFYIHDTGGEWVPISNRDDYAANWGIISDGYQIPRPISSTTGHVFDYDECIWSVSPAHFGNLFNMVTCTTDANGYVLAKFKMPASSSWISTVANYMIVGIRRNTNRGSRLPPPNVTPTPTPSNSVTPSKTPSVSASSTPTLPTPTPSSGGQAPSPTPRPRLVARFYNAYNPSETMTGLRSLCDVSNNVENRYGYRCNGEPNTCTTSNCAPSPENGAGLMVRVSGGVAPYTVRFTSWRGSFSPSTTSCFTVTSGSAIPLVINSDSLGRINTEASIVKNLTTQLDENDNTFGVTDAPIAMYGDCNRNSFNGIGTFSVVISDAAGATATHNLTWNISRFNSNI